MADSDVLTARTLVIAAQDLLRQGGYKVVTVPDECGLAKETAFLAEDQFGVILATAFDTWFELGEGWQQAQGSLVHILSDKLKKGNPKAWEGVLVLLTPAKSNDLAAEDTIRYDTTRVRKIVGTGESISFLDDLRIVLLPLLPFEGDSLIGQSEPNLLERLSSLLSTKGLDRRAVDAAVKAFQNDEPILESVSGVLPS